MKRIYLANLLTTGSKENRAKLIEEAEKQDLYSLETFYKERAVSKILEEHPKIKIFLDSGAHSLINKNTTISCVTVKDEEKGETVQLTVDDFAKLSGNDKVLISALRTGGGVGHGLTRLGAMKTGVLRRFIDFSFNESNEVKQYFDAYIAYVKKWEKRLYGYVNLDVIFNPQKSWENQKYMESCGLKPVPVYHFGEDQSWLRKYMDNYDYIGIGGLGQDITKDKFIMTFGDETWRYILSSKQNIKTHGFAVSSFELLKRYDWWSIDSTTWVKHAAYGNTVVPGRNPKTGKLDVNYQPILVYVSGEGLMRKTKGGLHYTIKYPKKEREEIEEYFKSIGVDVKKAKDSLYERMLANVRYFQRLSSSEFVSDMQHLVQERRRLF